MVDCVFSHQVTQDNYTHICPHTNLLRHVPIEILFLGDCVMLTINAKYHIQVKIWNFIMEASENDRNIRKDDIPPPLQGRRTIM